MELSRKDFLKLMGVAAVTGGGLLALGPVVRVVEMIGTENNAKKIQREIEGAVKLSLESGEVTVSLPKGEILIDRKIELVISKGAKIKIVGHDEGTLLKLDNKLSHVSSEHGSFAENCLMYFKDMEGSLSFEGIGFDGGSEIAGKGGYKAPPSPWNAVVFVNGRGAGDHFAPAMERAGNRQGTVIVNNCYFENSESGGFLAQNLEGVQFDNSRGENLDYLLDANWTDRVNSEHVYAEKCLSDGVYINDAGEVRLCDWTVVGARQGFDIQGVVGQAELEQCFAKDCAIAYVLAHSETDGTRVRSVSLKDSGSHNCLIVFSIGNVSKALIEGGVHNEAGGWMKSFLENDFLHIGITDPEELVPQSIVFWGDPSNQVKFRRVEVRESIHAPNNYVLTEAKGVGNFPKVFS